MPRTLDAKDLIDIVEHVRSISVERFGEWLREKGATAVLSFTNINDFVGPTLENNTFLNMRPLLRRIETLPLSDIREGPSSRASCEKRLQHTRKVGSPFPWTHTCGAGMRLDSG
jgi:hypothetical protein